ncbi:MAG: response regulator transcription factor [Lachnospiraceae bacterium]|nr:response regulator transcription factor [Lachnospiraceae bacterium]
MRVLLVEDDRYLSAAICKLLKQEHFTAEPVFDGNDGLDYALYGTYDAIVLDVMLPGKDGFAVLKELRSGGVHTPVLMLTARGDLEDRVKGLEWGADYYLPKPFEKDELVACLRAITRRREDVVINELAYGDLLLQEKDGSLLCRETGKKIRLGAKEYQMMELFLRNPGQILPKETMLERIWGLESEAEYNSLEVYVSFLRKKLSFLGSSVCIKTTRGLGYSLEAET